MCLFFRQCACYSIVDNGLLRSNIEFLINHDIQPHKNMLIVLFGLFHANISKITTVYHAL